MRRLLNSRRQNWFYSIHATLSSAVVVPLWSPAKQQQHLQQQQQTHHWSRFKRITSDFSDSLPFGSSGKSTLNHSHRLSSLSWSGCQGKMSAVKGLQTALKTRKTTNGGGAYSVSTTTMDNGRTSPVLEKPLNILIYTEEDILFEQQRLELEQPFINNVSGGVIIGGPQRKISNPGLDKLTTLWISNGSIVFKSLKKYLLQVVGLDRFTIYPITYEEIKSKPWQQTTALLICVIHCRKYKEEDEFLIKAEKALKEYITSDGRVVIYKLDELWENGDYILGGESGLRRNVFKQKLILKCGKEFFAGNGYQPNKDGRVIKFEDEEDLDQECPFKPSVAHLITSDADLIDAKFIERLNGNSRSLIQFYHSLEDVPKFERGSSNKLPVIINSDINSIPSSMFDFNAYFANLSSSLLGHHIVFADTTTSTMVLAEPLTQLDGLVAIANRQTEGKGRGENQWISPPGSLAYTVHFKISLASNLGQRLGFVQHLASLSMIKAILNTPGYAHLNLRLKWPNDIYWGESTKVGGNLVKSILQGNDVHCFLGCGLNVSNKYPTCSIEHIIKSTIDPSTGQVPVDLPPLSKEEILGRALSELETLIKKSEREGVQSIKEEYLKYWLHSGKTVRMANTKEVVIEGLDDQGYLLVKDVSTGLLMSVLPDGNRFDMLNNLLVRKV